MKINHLALLSLAFMVLQSACKKDDDSANNCTMDPPAETRFFEFQHDGGDTFYAWTTKQDVINDVEAQLALPINQRNQHINGKIAVMLEGCQLNKEWSWFFIPDEWVMADASIEICDGNPQYVEDHLEDYLHIGQYCPWGTIVLREVEKPF